MDSDPEVLSDSENGGTAKELKPTSKQSIARALLEDVDVRFAYLPLLTCCYISGLTDATIYNGKFHTMCRCDIKYMLRLGPIWSR